MKNPLFWARRSTLELYQGLVQSDHDNNVAVVLLVPLLGVDKGINSMMSATSHAPNNFFSSPHTFQTSVTPLAVYPPPGPDFNFNYGMVEDTPPAFLFATGPSGSSGCDDDQDKDDA
ncbi:hypothetical protein V6N13_020149 [Hibiscus sabdariffa]